MYNVRRLKDVNYQGEEVQACDHRDAAIRSLLAEPGAELVVNGEGTMVRFRVDALGRVREASRYDTSQARRERIRVYLNS